ncbi:hypothetical protein D3C78_820910 [compost metagenome]
MHKTVRVGDGLTLPAVRMTSQLVECSPALFLRRRKKAGRAVQTGRQQVTQPFPAGCTCFVSLVPVGRQCFLKVGAQGQRQSLDFFLDNPHVGAFRPLRFIGQARGNPVGEEVCATVNFFREIQAGVVAQIIQGHIDQQFEIPSPGLIRYGQPGDIQIHGKRRVVFQNAGLKDLPGDLAQSRSAGESKGDRLSRGVAGIET